MTQSARAADAAHAFDNFMAAGSSKSRIMCADMDTAAMIPNTAILDFNLRASKFHLLISIYLRLAFTKIGL